MKQERDAIKVLQKLVRVWERRQEKALALPHNRIPMSRTGHALCDLRGAIRLIEEAQAKENT